MQNRLLCLQDLGKDGHWTMADCFEYGNTLSFFIKSGHCSLNNNMNKTIYHKVTLRSVRVTIVAVEKQQYYIPSACVCSLRYHAREAHTPYYIVICGLSGPTIFFNSSSQTAQISWIALLNIKCVLWFFLRLSFETFLILHELGEILSQMYIDLQVKFPLVLSGFNKTWIFSPHFQKLIRYKLSWKSVQWEPSCSMRTDGQKWWSY